MLASTVSSFGHATNGIQYDYLSFILNQQINLINLEQKINKIS
jgi:hypothetical protein